MIHDPTEDRRREILINRMLEGIAGDSEIEQLETLLAASPEALDSYLDMTSIHAMLQWRMGEVLAKTEGSPALPAGATSDATSEDTLAGAVANTLPRSPVLGFLGSFGNGLGSISSFTPTLWALLILVSGIVFTGVTVLIVAIHGIRVQVADSGEQASKGTSSPLPIGPMSPIDPISPIQGSQAATSAAPHPSSFIPHPSPVARLTRMADCRWVVANAAPQSGDRLMVGQTLQLAAGVACLEFDIGAKLVLQGPADLTIVAEKKLRLDRGKLTAEITSEKAHGFTVFTPQGTLVDLGTEFGVEIAPEGSSKVHVFRGKVEVALPSINGQPLRTTQCLLADSDARVEAGTDTMSLFADTGESFVRTLDRLKKDEHIVAYWRFEDRPLGTVAPHTERNHQPVRATVDSSYNGNDLYAWSDESRPKFSGQAPQNKVPQTGSKNLACLDTSEPVPNVGYPVVRNVYTHSAFSHAAPIDIQKITPAQWTIEASVKPITMGNGPQTIVGRDARFPRTDKKPSPPQRLSLEVNARRRFAIRYCDMDNRMHEAVAEQLPVQVNHWYHLAAVSDGHALRLYVDDHDGRGYQLRASTELPKTGRTALSKGENTAEWTIGRGLVKGFSGAGFQGLIDEVRVSDIARTPGELLFAPSGAPATADSPGITKTARLR